MHRSSHVETWPHVFVPQGFAVAVHPPCSTETGLLPALGSMEIFEAAPPDSVMDTITCEVSEVVRVLLALIVPFAQFPLVQLLSVAGHVPVPAHAV